MAHELVMVEVEDRVVIYLTAERVIRLYANAFRITPQQAADQLRNRPGLEGACNRPQFHAYYDHADIPFQAAYLAHGIAETQPFVEGNKRVALAAMLLFLQLNGYFLDEVSQDQRAAWMLGLSSTLTPEALADQIRQNARSVFHD